MIYLVFRDPFGSSANLRSIIVLPCLGATVGSLCSDYLGLTPASVALDTMGVLTLQTVLKARMPPALALSVLAMLLRVKTFTYLLGVAEASVVIALVFFLWRRFAIAPLVREPLETVMGEFTVASEAAPPTAAPTAR